MRTAPVLTALICLASSLFASDDGSLAGQVTELQGKPVSGAKLRLSSAGGDSGGRFVFSPPRQRDRTNTTLLALNDVSRMSANSESQDHPLATSEKADFPQLSGTVIDMSGAAIGGATVQVQSANGTVLRTTQSDTNGSFAISMLSAGDYRLVISRADFEAKEIPVTIGAEAPAPFRISLALAAVSTIVNVQGREDDLTGVAQSATQGTVGAKELEDRPILRSGEVLETVPGVIITQHAGGGKANQYFLRGFNLDHGTDFAVFLDDMPLNLPSHAHGEGYADMNTVIPELVQRVNYEKGPYYADVGNYGSAGSAHLEFFKTLPVNFFQVEGGMYGYERAVFGVSQKVGSGNLLFGGEVAHDDGPWTHPDDYLKFNGLLTYSRGDEAKGFSITARGYHGKWNSSDQIADNAVPLVGFFGSLNPTDGGNSQRYSLQTNGIARAQIPGRKSRSTDFTMTSICFPISLIT